MSDEERQPVADADNPETQQSSGAEEGAQDDLDQLLAEYESSTESDNDSTSSGGRDTKEQPSSTDAISDARVRDVVSWVDEQRQREIAERTREDVDNAAKALREGWDDAPPETLLKGKIYERAAEDRRFLNAFQTRHRDPDKWNRILKATQKELQRELTAQPDRDATEDRNAVSSAIRSSSKAPPPNEGPSESEIAGYSDSEFEKYRRSLLHGGG